MNRRSSLLALLFVATTAFAQNPPSLEQGLKPYGAYQGGDLDSVSLTNGNLTLHIPLLSFPQRGALTLNFFIMYNAKNWQVHSFFVGNTFKQQWQWRGAAPLTGVVVDWDHAWSTSSIIDSGTQAAMTRAIAPDGSSHPMGNIPGTSTLIALDASGIRAAGLTVYDAKGVKHDPSAGAITDPNGNQITYTSTSITDSLGRAFTGTISSIGKHFTPGSSTTDFSNCPSGTASANIWNPPGPNGGTSTFKLCYKSFALQSSFGISGIQEGSATVSFLTAVVLPNLSSWTFNYNTFGDLLSVGFPTGGSLSYQWASTGAACGALNQPVSRTVTQRSLDANDGNGPRTWKYNYSLSNSKMTVTDPSMNDAVHTFSGEGGGCSVYVTDSKYYQGASPPGTGTLLKTVDTHYSAIVSPYGATQLFDNSYGADIVADKVTTTWANGKVSQTAYTYDSGDNFTVNGVTPQTNYALVHGSLVHETDYDYGSGGPGGILRQVQNSYEWQVNSNYATANLFGLPASTVVSDSGSNQCARTDFTYDDSTKLDPSGIGTSNQHIVPVGGLPRGNPSTLVKWVYNGSSSCAGTASQSLTTIFNYYDTGELHIGTDPGGNQTTYTYSATYAGAYVTSTQLPSTGSPAVAHTVSGTYDFNSGLLASFTDQNSQISGYSYDNMWRMTKATFPDGGESDFFYPNTTQVEQRQKMDSTGRQTDFYLLVDGVGRESRRASWDDQAAKWDQVDTSYDLNGRVGFVSYPYQGAGFSAAKVTSGAGDATGYDALGRVTSITHSDASAISTTYTGAAVQVSDEGNGTRRVTRIAQSDGLGRLTSVCEVSSASLLGVAPAACNLDIGGTGFLTSYLYDPLGNLTSAQQAGLSNRTFLYDSLSRLKSATNPESGTITYAYLTSGSAACSGDPTKVCKKTDARGITTTYSYDQDARLTVKSYSDSTPMVMYGYDVANITMNTTQFTVLHPIGRLSWEATLNSSFIPTTMSAFSYDPMGRIGELWSCQDVSCSQSILWVSYGYDLIGNEVDRNNSGSDYNATYNTLGKLVTFTKTNFTDATHPVNRLTGGSYDAYGHLVASTLGNGLSESWAYDARGRLSAYATGSGCSAGNCSTNKYRFTLTYEPNSDILSASDTVNGSWTYSYDDFNRLLTSNCSATCPDGLSTQGFSYVYDRYGNRAQQNVTAGSGPAPQFTFSNNRIVGRNYDLAGNLLNDGAHTYAYDAENRIISVDGAAFGYFYDAEGRRLEKSTNGVRSEDYFYGRDGNVMIQTNVPTFIETYVGGMHLSTEVLNAAHNGTNLYFHHADWLGTERVRSDMTGTACETIGSLPFGDGQVIAGTCGDVSQRHFTGKERDNESGLDMFGARYYGSSMGRFMSTDPKILSHQRMADPQQWNAYQYSRNSPSTFFDPDGMETQLAVGMSGKDEAYVINHLARMYHTAAGKGFLERAAQDKFTIAIGTGHLGRTDLTNAPAGAVVFGGKTKVEGGKTSYGTVAADGHKLLVAKSPDSPTAPPITVTIDKDQASEINKDPATVLAHELGGHTADVLNAAESNVNQFIDAVNPNSEATSEAAERAAEPLPKEPTPDDVDAVKQLLHVDERKPGEPK